MDLESQNDTLLITYVKVCTTHNNVISGQVPYNSGHAILIKKRKYWRQTFEACLKIDDGPRQHLHDLVILFNTKECFPS